MTGRVTALLEDYLTLRRGLGYRSPSQERALRAFARYLDRDDHEGPIPLERSLDWATSTASTDPCNPSRRLTSVRGFLRHLSALDGATEVPAPGLLGPQGHRTPRRTSIATARSQICYRPLPGCPRRAGCAHTATSRCGVYSPAPVCGSPKHSR